MSQAKKGLRLMASVWGHQIKELGKSGTGEIVYGMAVSLKIECQADNATKASRGVLYLDREFAQQHFPVGSRLELSCAKLQGDLFDEPADEPSSSSDDNLDKPTRRGKPPLELH